MKPSTSPSLFRSPKMTEPPISACPRHWFDGRMGLLVSNTPSLPPWAPPWLRERQCVSIQNEEIHVPVTVHISGSSRKAARQLLVARAKCPHPG